MIAIAPRVVVYPFGSMPPEVGAGWTALAVIMPAAVAAGHSGFARGPVFGDGSHPTTRLCAAAVDLLCRQQPGVAVLDVGTGTGILARIARARGAGFVVGTDIDAVAVECARAHAELDGVGCLSTSEAMCVECLAPAPAPAPAAADTPIVGCLAPADPVGLGWFPPADAAVQVGAPGGCIHFGSEPPDHWGARFGLVVANILEAPLHSLAPALRRALLPGGVLLISGFTRPQAPALRLAYEAAGLQSIGEFSLDEWALLKFSAPVAHPSHHSFRR